MNSKLMIVCMMFFSNFALQASLENDVNEDELLYEYEYVYKETNVREKRTVGIAAQVGGGAVLGFTFDYFVTEHINLELSFVGGYLPIILGIKYYMNPTRNWSPYMGLHGNPYVGYLPFGIEYLGDNGLTFAIEAGPAFLADNGFYPWGGIKIGYHF